MTTWGCLWDWDWVDPGDELHVEYTRVLGVSVDYRVTFHADGSTNSLKLLLESYSTDEGAAVGARGRCYRPANRRV